MRVGPPCRRNTRVYEFHGFRCPTVAIPEDMMRDRNAAITFTVHEGPAQLGENCTSNSKVVGSNSVQSLFQ